MLTLFLAMSIRKLWGGVIPLEPYLRLLPFFLLTLFLNLYRGLYGNMPMARPEEMRTLAISISLTYLCMGISFFFTREGIAISRFTFAGAWFFSLFTVPLARAFLRARCAAKKWWGVPAVIIGSRERVPGLLEQLRRTPSIGLRPVAYVGNEPSPDGDLPLFSVEELQDYSKSHYGNICALVLADDTYASSELESLSNLFRDIIFLPNWYGCELTVFGTTLAQLGDFVGLKSSQKLLDPRRRTVKRIIDIVGAGTGLILLAPVFALLALAIRLDSPGNPFYRQKRIGLGGNPLYVLKLRSMAANADELLKQHLASSPETREEWSRDQKLCNDPRITRFGRFLRATSLDELPQLWNVLRGEMSLVGPRPIVADEIAKYGAAFELYKRVRPGITGLWQVSGRSDTAYTRRVWLDRFYVYNWSFWLDIYILMQTIPVVLYRRGAR